ncbi:hypothetical protein FIBSPDRAFT_905878 [Athelia psychrophila]|uniref:Uncharacterized protein n=1 Tax=Athelia psychrophila TaxID=1759441 RepID=A0A167SZL7_9AGAM|nr:hypothetical protein FIBSPDRAFT_905878 [Fibularhizoctonia sp. CBS 109695]
MCMGVDIAGFQAAVDARFLAQMQGRDLSVGWAPGLVDVRGSLEAPGINHVLAEWEPETVAAVASGEITEEDYSWMMSALPALPDVPDDTYNGAMVAPLLASDDYNVALDHEGFFEFSNVPPSSDRAVDVANAMDVGGTWGESLRGGLASSSLHMPDRSSSAPSSSSSSSSSKSEPEEEWSEVDWEPALATAPSPLPRVFDEQSELEHTRQRSGLPKYDRLETIGKEGLRGWAG